MYPRAILRLNVTALVVMLSLSLGACGALQPQNAEQGPPGSTYSSTTYGYQIDLPKGWRHSDALSVVVPNSADVKGWDVFTIRSEQDEDLASVKGQEGAPGPAWQYVAVVEVYWNPGGLTPLQWANSRGEQAVRQTIESVKFAGRPAARKTHGGRFETVYYVADRDSMFAVGYKVHPEVRPPGANEEALQGIINSFRFVPGR